VLGSRVGGWVTLRREFRGEVLNENCKHWAGYFVEAICETCVELSTIVHVNYRYSHQDTKYVLPRAKFMSENSHVLLLTSEPLIRGVGGECTSLG
jgi:hypothetical protein